MLFRSPGGFGGRLGGGADLRVVPGGPAEAVPADPAAPVGPGSAEPVDDADRFGGVRHPTGLRRGRVRRAGGADRKSTRLKSSHVVIKYADVCCEERSR